MRAADKSPPPQFCGPQFCGPQFRNSAIHKMKKQPGPRLQKLIENGDYPTNNAINNAIYVYDGVIMILGGTDNFEEIENYLKEYPTPEYW